MSRTDVHTPYWVKTRSREWREFFTESHNHEIADCDLDAFFTDDFRWTRTRCRMQMRADVGAVRCGCPGCTGQRARKQARRQERTELRIRIRDILKTGRDDVDTVDVPRPGPVRGWR